MKNIKILWTGKEKNISVIKQLSQPGAEVSVIVLLLGDKNHTVNINIRVIHNQPATKSHIIIKGLLQGQSRVTVTGNIILTAKALNSSTQMDTRLLLLSDRAGAVVIPNLEISQNDVSAGHSVTITKVDENELFYLMSRGLSKPKAIKLIADGFIVDMRDLIK